jgi:hypothetical protein
MKIVSILPCGSVKVSLARHREHLVICPNPDGGFDLYGVNSDRGFSWYVGSFLEFATAATCAKALRAEEMAGGAI